MERLLSVAPENPRVAYINAVLGHSAQVFREQGYLEVLKKHPEATLVCRIRQTGQATRHCSWLKTGSRPIPMGSM
jgi:ABC-type sugar transport system substrate-binding protein